MAAPSDHDDPFELVRVDPATAQALEATMAVRTVAKPIDIKRCDAVQLILQRLGYDIGTEAGVYGHMTRDAIRHFQQNNGLEADGTLTRATVELVLGLGQSMPGR